MYLISSTLSIGNRTGFDDNKFIDEIDRRFSFMREGYVSGTPGSITKGNSLDPQTKTSFFSHLATKDIPTKLLFSSLSNLLHEYIDSFWGV